MTQGRRLYAIPGCPFGHRAAFSMREKGLDFELKIYPPNKRPPELDAVSTRAKSPTLFDGDVAVFESTVVLEYLEDRYPEKPLMPRAPADRARARMLITQATEELGPKLVAMFKAWFSQPRDPDAVRAAGEDFNGQLATWDRLCQANPYLCGNELTLADLVLYTPFVGWRNLSGFEPDAKFEHLRAWIARMGERPTSAPIPKPE